MFSFCVDTKQFLNSHCLGWSPTQDYKLVFQYTLICENTWYFTQLLLKIKKSRLNLNVFIFGRLINSFTKILKICFVYGRYKLFMFFELGRYFWMYTTPKKVLCVSHIKLYTITNSVTHQYTCTYIHMYFHCGFQIASILQSSFKTFTLMSCKYGIRADSPLLHIHSRVKWNL